MTNKLLDLRPNSLIISAGMPRSGSTWLYNALRLILEESLLEFDSGWFDDKRDQIGIQRLLIKTHHFEAEFRNQSALIFYSFRDIRDSLASAKRMFGHDPSLARARLYYENYQTWSKIADYTMKYENMKQSPDETISSICNVLGLTNINPDKIANRVGRLRHDPKEGHGDRYNPVNLLHKNHITNGEHGSWDDGIPVHLLREIENEFGEWFVKHGYF
ncbi:MAG: sulfotransferase domain-containing protein [Halioglobus sp.]